MRDVNLSNMSLIIVPQYKTIKSQEGVNLLKFGNVDVGQGLS